MTNEQDADNPLRERRILLASDGSMPAIAATKKAIDLAVLMDAVVYVTTVPERTPLTILEQMGEQVDDSRYTGQLADGPEVAREYGLLHEVEVRELPMGPGPIVGSILKAANEIQPDMIVLGNSGRGGWERLTLGSVAEGVMRHSPYPVTMTKGWDKDELQDLLAIAKGLMRPSLDFTREAKFRRIPVSELNLGRRLGVSFLALLTFLIPYFGLGILNTFYPETAMTVVFGSFTIAILWIMALFPLGILTGLGFHRIASAYD